MLIANVLDQLLDFLVLGIDVGPLKDAWKETSLPVLRLLNRVSSRAHRNETRHVLVLRTEAVGHPRSQTWTDQPSLSAVHEQQGWLMIGHVSVHGTDDAD